MALKERGITQSHAWSCPWCSDDLDDPLTGDVITTFRQYDRAMEAHTKVCVMHVEGE